MMGDDEEQKQFCNELNSVPECNGDDCTARYEKMNDVLNSSDIPYGNESLYNSTMDAVKQNLELVKQQLNNAGSDITNAGILRGLARRLQT